MKKERRIQRKSNTRRSDRNVKSMNNRGNRGRKVSIQDEMDGKKEERK